MAEAGGVQQRIRELPSRVVVYLLLAAALFEDLGYLGVWRKPTSGLDGLAVPSLTATALWQARRRVGVAPLWALFDLLRGPAGSALTTASRWCGLLVVAIDGTTVDVPDSPANRRHLGKHGIWHGGAGYPQIRLLALVARGTRAVIDAVFGPRTQGEPTQARRLLRARHAGMIVLLDRGVATNDFIAATAATGADLLVRLTAGRRPPVLARYRDGSCLSNIAGVQVRVIECAITVTTTAGTHTGVYRLATTLLDHYRHPAFDLVKLYHERWEIESAYFEIKSTLLGRRVLRSRTPHAIAQEIYALLTLYQVLRIAITDATDAIPAADPDRASFTIAAHTARDLVIQAAGVIAGATIDLVGAIGRRLLDNLMPPRRIRTSPRAVKRPLSRLRLQEPARQPHDLQGHHRHRHPHRPRPLTAITNP
ncbi:IS4 family transposase [Carbonactinospora thermoautotrophica]|uniref:IS4 family transposase n=1 Tax=Carbonactinospora thermoautotrophica TaxID=1469144 RepID=UPI0022716B7D|nr:IS4 family transposase [Carbonactinospora thermoautotrophica]